MSTIAPAHFLQTLFGEAPAPGQLMLRTVTTRGGRSFAYWPGNLDEAARKACQYKKSRDVYFCVSPQNRELALRVARRRRPRAEEGHVRGSEPSATVLPFLWAELAGHPPRGRDALGLLEALPRPPAILVNISAGYEAYWPLRRPLTLATPEARFSARRLILKLHAALAAAAADNGWSLVQSANLAHLLRMPGTLNHRTSPGRPVEVERFPLGPGLGDQACDPGVFDALPEPSEGAGAGALLRDLDLRRDRGPAADFRPVFRGCAFLQYCYAERTGLSEKELRAALRVVVHCRIGDAGGRRLAHRMTREHPGYTMAGTDGEVDAALAAGGPATCRRIGRLGERAAACCAGCPHAGLIATPVALGRRAAGEVAAFRGPAAGGPALAGGPGELAAGRPRAAGGREPGDAGDPDPDRLRGLLRGLDRLLRPIGGVATSRVILDRLAARGGPEPRSALAGIFPTLDAGTLPTPAQLSARFRSLCDRAAGGLCLERRPRAAAGVRWSVRRVTQEETA